MNCAMRTNRCWAGRMYQLLRGEAADSQTGPGQTADVWRYVWREIGERRKMDEG